MMDENRMSIEQAARLRLSLESMEILTARSVPSGGTLRGTRYPHVSTCVYLDRTGGEGGGSRTGSGEKATN